MAVTGGRRRGYSIRDFAPRRVKMITVTQQIEMEKHIAESDSGEFGQGEWA